MYYRTVFNINELWVTLNQFYLTSLDLLDSYYEFMMVKTQTDNLYRFQQHMVTDDCTTVLMRCRGA